MRNQIIEYLLQNANPSIVLRIKKEILKDISETEEAKLLEQIQQERSVALALSSQKENGWIGEFFHGSENRFDNMEVGLRFLAEKGFSPNHPAVVKAAQALIDTPKADPAYGVKTPLKTPEEDYADTGVGIYLPRSSVLLRAGYEEIAPRSTDLDLYYDVDFALRSFEAVLQVDTPDQIIETRRGKPCFRPGVRWPCLYHLRMLAFSRRWRCRETMDLLAQSIAALYDFPSVGFVYTYCHNQLKGPCMALAHSGPVNESLESGSVGGMYFDRLELLARCGALTRVDCLRKEYDLLLSYLEEGPLFTGEVNRTYALGWSPYFGFALEVDWRSKKRKQCDILFRILMIMNHREETM